MRAWGTLLVLGLSAIPVAAEAQVARAIALPAQPLATTLHIIARKFGIELLFAPDALAGRQAPAISGPLTAEQALANALADSGFTAHRISNGSYVITAAPSGTGQADLPVPEILVTGRRSQNADIERTENDVRPYQVATRREIADAHIATVEELAGKRLTANANSGNNAQGETSSAISLRGLGTDQTLILIDGRRLPRMPDRGISLNQSDVNALSPDAIERVEAITSTAGGIYGPGAIAGVLNIVLHRDYRGADLVATRGISARGDGAYGRLDARIGFTPDGGDTDVMLAASFSNFAGLKVGERDYTQLAWTREYRNNPSYAIPYSLPASGAITVVSDDNGIPLTFKSSYGGGALGSYYSHVAPADGRNRAALVQQLTANAGTLDLVPGPNVHGGAASLVSGRRTHSVLGNIRHRMGGLELFADLVLLSNTGSAVVSDGGQVVHLGASDPANPFEQAIDIYSDQPDGRRALELRNNVQRYSLGAILDLPQGWRGEADYAWGGASRTMSMEGSLTSVEGIYALYGLAPGVSLNPLGDFSTFSRLISGYQGYYVTHLRQTNAFQDAQLRVAGPVLALAGGPLTATLLAEHRRERNRGGTYESVAAAEYGNLSQHFPDTQETVESLYAELRAPLLGKRHSWSWLKSLELQLAVRYDRTIDDLPGALEISGVPSDGSHSTVLHGGPVYTAGFKASPVDALILRASMATGEQSPEVNRMITYSFAYSGQLDKDPKRPGERIGAPYTQLFGGSGDAKPEWARSISAGIVLMPLQGLRLSLDYTAILRRRELVSSVDRNSAYFLANEAAFPSRVVRLPLTAADIAKGYTGGVITAIDSSSLNIGRTTLHTLDVQLDYRFATSQVGTFNLHTAATWQPIFRRTLGPGLPTLNYKNSSDGALALRGYAGIEWSLGALTLAASGQYFGSYRVTSADDATGGISTRYNLISQGSDHIPAQGSFDLALHYRVSLPHAGSGSRPRSLELRFGIQDLLDSRAPIVVNTYGGYSDYADPRRRRFDLSIATGI